MVALSAAPVRKSVALVSMPTLSGRFPSFQLALLRPTLERAGIDCQAFSLFMYFGAQVGWRANEALAEVWPCMVGEWIWSKEAHGDAAVVPGGFGDDDAYYERFRSNFEQIERQCGVSFDELLRIKHEKVPAFLDFCTETVDWSRFGLVGFTCVFQQNLASIALARRLKAAYPETSIIFGGGGFEDDIADEVFRENPAIDLMHCGDADLTFPEIARRVLDGEPVKGAKGLWWRDGDRRVFEGRAPNLEDLDQTPVPDFDEYFYAQKQTGYAAYAGTDEVMIPIETARGCWWGMRNHCTFCGLNRQGMAFRAKSVGNVLDMVGVLSARYQQRTFDAIDNIISTEYVEGLFGKLADAKADLRFHYEVRPTLTRAQLRRMRDGGLYSVQPGIESLNTHVLQLMNKRSTGMRNVEFMKWCTYYGIHNLYNILLRFPGETKADYDEQVETIRKIPHFQPPKFITKARADRGSPMFTAPETQQISSLRPSRCYPFLYPKDRYDLSRVSYYFEHSIGGVCKDEDYDAIFAAVAEWQARWKGRRRPRLTYAKAWGSLRIEDARAANRTETITLSGRAARIYELLLDAKRPETLAGELDPPPPPEPEAGPPVPPTLSEADQALVDELVRRELVLALDGRLLALALPENVGH